jgi:hypothetical protein
LIYIGDQGIVIGTGISIEENTNETDPEAQPKISLSKATFNTFSYIEDGIPTVIQPSIIAGENATNLTIGDGGNDITVAALDKNFLVESNNFNIDENGNLEVSGEITLSGDTSNYAQIDDITVSSSKTWSSKAITEAIDLCIPLAQKAAPDGIASLDGDGKISIDQLPNLTLTDVSVVATEVDQLALEVQEGDVCKRSDTTSTYMALNANNGSMSDWVEITAAGEVLSVAGRIGTVVLGPSDVGLSNVTNETQLTIANNLNDLNDPAEARVNLGLSGIDDNSTSGASYIGVFNTFNNSNSSNVQTALSDFDTVISNKSDSDHSHDVFIGDTGSGGAAGIVPAPLAGDANKFLSGSGDFQVALIPDGNLSEITDAEVARTNLELGGSAVLEVGTIDGTVAAGDHAHPLVTITAPGFMSAVDKTKLDDVEDNANAYIHPTISGNVHLPVGGGTNEFVKWAAEGVGQWMPLTTNDIPDLGEAATLDVGTASNNVAPGVHDHVIVSEVVDGYMSTEDKIKLDSIDANLQIYVHPTDNGNLHIPENGAIGEFVKWAASGMGTWSNVDITDVNGLGNSATLDVGTIAGTVSEGDHGHDNVTITVSGYMSSADKTKLDAVEADANNYIHPNTTGNMHIPTAGATGEFVKWAADGTGSWSGITNSDVSGLGNSAILDTGTTVGTVATGDHGHDDVIAGGSSGYLSGSDKTKLDNIDDNANNYTHPTTDGNVHIPAAGATGEFVKWTAAGTGSWSSITNSDVSGLGGSAILDVGTTAGTVASGNHGHSIVNNSNSGYMSAADKTKLDAVEADANNYIHPTTTGNMHIPTAGTTGEFVKWASDGTGSWAGITNLDISGLGDISTLNLGTVAGTVSEGNHGHINATTSISGYMSDVDKTKLDGIEAGASIYTHPTTTGNNHIPAAGATGEFVKWSSDGTGSWSGITNSDVSGLGNSATLDTGITAGTVSEGNHGHDEATTSISGYMSSGDKVKLDAVEDDANNYIHPTTTGNNHIPTAGVSGEFVKWASDGTGSWVSITSSDVSGLGNSATLDTGTTAGTVAAGDHGHNDATISAPGYMSGADKTKLDGISAGAVAYNHPTGDGNTHLPAGGITGDFIKWDSLGTGSWTGITNSDVSGLGTSAVLDMGTATGTVAAGDHGHATVVAAGASGFMTGADKTKLDSMEANANNYTHPTGNGNIHVPAGGIIGNFIKWDSLGTGSWSGITNNDVSGLGNSATLDTGTTAGTVAAGDHGHSTVVAAGASGFMTGADKTKLDGIAEGATVYTHPTGTGNNHIPAGGSANQVLRWDSDGAVVWSDAIEQVLITDPVIQGPVNALSIGNAHTFNALGTTLLDANATTITYNWAVTGGTGTLSATTGDSVTLTFDSGDLGATASITCYATDDTGHTSGTSALVFTVFNAVLPSGISLSLPSELYINVAANVNAIVGDNGGDLALSYAWETSIDDGTLWTTAGLSNANIPNPTVTFIATGAINKIRCTVTNAAGDVTTESASLNVFDTAPDGDSDYLDTGAHAISNVPYTIAVNAVDKFRITTGVPFVVGDHIQLQDNIITEVTAVDGNTVPQIVTIIRGTVTAGTVNKLTNSYNVPVISQDGGQFDFNEANIEVHWTRNKIAVTESGGNVVIAHGATLTRPFMIGDKVIISGDTDVITTISVDPIRSGTNPYFTTIATTDALPSNPVFIDLIPITLEADLNDGVVVLQPLIETYSILSSVTGKVVATLSGDRGANANIAVKTNNVDFNNVNIIRVSSTFTSIQN